MSEQSRLIDEMNTVSPEVLEELTRRVKDIEQSYRAVALKMGQLYMRADEHAASSLTRSLDKPMRNASDNERSFAAILEVLQNLSIRAR